jgi:hypothetical protein
MQKSFDLNKTIQYFESKYAFKRKYELGSTTEIFESTSYLNNNVYFVSLLKHIIEYHLKNNFSNFNNYSLNKFTYENPNGIDQVDTSSSKSPTKDSPLKKMFNFIDTVEKISSNNLSPTKSTFDSQQEISDNKRNGIVLSDKTKSLFPRVTANGFTISELRTLFDESKLQIVNNTSISYPNSLFSPFNIENIITDDMLFTISSLQISNNLFTSARIFILLDNLFFKLDQIFNDIQDGLDDYKQISERFSKNKVDCEVLYKTNPKICTWFLPTSKMVFSMSKFLESIHLVLYIYTINTVLYCSIDEDQFLWLKIDGTKKFYFKNAFEKCKKNILYKSKSKNSYMICDISPNQTEKYNSYESLKSFHGLLRLVSITYQLSSAISNI